MKKLYIIIIFMSAVTFANAQKHPLLSCSESKIVLNKSLINFDESKYETKAYYDYDVKYYRLNFFFENLTDDSHIKGDITTYFETNSSGFNQITFDFANNMIVDSIIFHENKITTYTLANDELIINLPSVIATSTLDSISVFYNGNPLTGGFVFTHFI